jgi:DNA-binding NtrC family response regulator
LRPVGGERDEAVDVRVLAATHRPLEELVRENRFREDLFYRLSVVTLKLPPLRSRADDIPSLASHFLTAIAESHRAPRKRLTRDALNKLLRAPWPGNVRQLKHVLESAVVLADGDVIDAEALSIEGPRGGTAPPPEPHAATEGTTQRTTATRVTSPSKARKAAERQRILDALEHVNWNKVKAAKALDMPRRTLYRRLREYGLLDEDEN